MKVATLFFLSGIFFFSLFSCRQPVLKSSLGKTGCKKCHTVILDKYHKELKCTFCHKGNNKATIINLAHKDLIYHPAALESLNYTCKKCHPIAVKNIFSSKQATLTDEVSLVWKAFFPKEYPPTLKKLISLDKINKLSNIHKLVADLLCRRCLRCHLYSSGDNYKAVMHGLGCAACHMLPLNERSALYHKFLKIVPDKNCLTCHHNNFVGWDFYGRFDKDFDEAYRCPLLKGENPSRPYGIEWHEMSKDIHRKAGFSCITCHIIGACGLGINSKNNEVFFKGKVYTLPKKLIGQKNLSCLDCHLYAPPNWRLSGPHLDQKIVGHRPQDIKKVACGCCHAKWTFIDMGRYLSLQIYPDYQSWQYLKVQECSEVENLINLHLKYPGLSLEAYMKNQFTNKKEPGIWLESFYKRRWSPVPMGFNKNGKLVVIRPLLDIYLSYIDKNDNIVFSNLHPKTVWLPYTPHTISKADTFRTLKIQAWLLGITKKPLGLNIIKSSQIF